MSDMETTVPRGYGVKHFSEHLGKMHTAMTLDSDRKWF